MNYFFCKISLLFLLVFSVNAHSQIADIFRFEVTHLPSKNNSYDRFRGALNVPVKLKDSDYMIFGFDYSKINIVYNDNLPIEDSEFDKFQVIDFNIGYTHKMNEKWRYILNAKPGISTNVEDGLKNGSFTFSGSVLFINDHTKDPSIKHPYRFIFGVTYSGNGGFAYPMPFINYYRVLTKKWSYTLGIPKTRLKYKFSSKFAIESYIGLDGFNSNIQDANPNALFNTNKSPQTIRMQLLLGGLGYDYNITKHLVLYAKTSYIIGQSLQLRDDARDTLYDFDINTNLYLRGGIKFKI